MAGKCSPNPWCKQGSPATVDLDVDLDGDKRPQWPASSGCWPAGEQLGVNALWVLVDTKLSMSQHCVLAAKAANGILVCVCQSIASKLRLGFILLCSALMRPYLEERHGHCGESPPKVHEYGEGTATSLLRGKAGRAETGERKAEGDLT